MNKWFLVGAAALLAVGATAAAEAPSRERAVEGGVAFLVKAQEKDGGWKGMARRKGVGVSGLAVLALLSAGDEPGKGPRGEAAEKGLRWVLSQQRADGVISSDRTHEMYDHGIATLALTEAALMTRDPRITRAALQGARFIVAAQDTQTGGWRYFPGEQGDTSESEAPPEQPTAEAATDEPVAEVPIEEEPTEETAAGGETPEPESEEE